jgi:hypothetical protein
MAKRPAAATMTEANFEKALTRVTQSLDQLKAAGPFFPNGINYILLDINITGVEFKVEVRGPDKAGSLLAQPQQPEG